MQVALISDIHGNAVALEAVLKDLASLSLDRVVCLGDVAAWGPEPRRCVELVAAAGCETVMGNSDTWMLNPEPFVEPTLEQRRNEEIDWWCRAQLGRAELAVLETYDRQVRVELGDGENLLCCHGSPRSFHDPIHSETPETVLNQMLEGVEESMLAAGHTHVQMVRRYGAMLLLNPGSVGMPYIRLSNGRVRNPVWAEYALLELEASGAEVTMRRVPFDVGELRSVVLSSDMPHAEAWLADRW